MTATSEELAGPLHINILNTILNWIRIHSSVGNILIQNILFRINIVHMEWKYRLYDETAKVVLNWIADSVALTSALWVVVRFPITTNICVMNLYVFTNKSINQLSIFYS